MNGAEYRARRLPVAYPRSVSDSIVLECPACGASELADPAVLCDAPTIVCRNCGETWPSAPKRRKRMISVTDATDGRDLVDAEKRPLVTFSNGAEQAWARKVEGDILPEQAPAPRRGPLIAAATAAMLFVAAFVVAKGPAVAALPDLAGLYAAVGLPVNLDGLYIEVKARRKSAEDPNTLVVVGAIRNVGAIRRTVPPLIANFPGETGDGGNPIDAPADDLAPGESVAFELEIADVPEHAEVIELRFRRPSEPSHGA